MRLTASWCNQDIFFLTDALRRGMSFAEVAGFLARDVGEVRDKAEHLGIKIPHSVSSKAAEAKSPWSLRATRLPRAHVTDSGP
jgi:hypothetical protein